MLLYSIICTTVVGWGLCGMFLLLFDLVLLTRIKQPFLKVGS